MHNRIARSTIALAAACIGVSLAYAATPIFWQVSNEAEFSKGEVENLSIDGYGRLTLGPSATSVYEMSSPFLWSMVSSPDGTVYVGTGARGRTVCRDVARRPHLQDRRGRPIERPLRPSRQVHMVACRRSGGKCLCGHRRQGCRL
jgi:hypothetical protein